MQHALAFNYPNPQAEPALFIQDAGGSHAASEPSKADISVMHCIRDALAFVDMRILDHLIVAGSDVVSLAERGLI
ncbi:JAB domain-containing protein [Bordetella genomosp. 10]|nr:JAB domain-containing protein [Bordetella genomosp. 10]